MLSVLHTDRDKAIRDDVLFLENKKANKAPGKAMMVDFLDISQSLQLTSHLAMNMKLTLWASFGIACSNGLLQPQQEKKAAPLLEVEELKRAIHSGRVFQKNNFLNEDQVQAVLAEVGELEAKGGFERKGLSNTVAKNQTFDKKLDRSICPIPWFFDALEGKDNRAVPSLIRELQLTLSHALNRPEIADLSISHECYYSKSEVGSRLPRHMDERHEELKGAKGWLVPSRRSISWLIYLSDSDWDLDKNGGALRSFPQRQLEYDATHDGNLQIGWLSEDNRSSKLVYLDSWFPVKGVVGPDGSTPGPEPHCILYTLDGQGNRDQLTRPYLTDQLQGMTTPGFLKACAQNDSIESQQPILFFKAEVARQFALLEDRASWDEGGFPTGSEIVDTVPLRGSLVVFDSVKVPHEVQLIHTGTRVALAGWFHEKTQEFPNIYY